MAKTTSIFARVEPEIKEQAEKVLNELGIPMSSAISIFLIRYMDMSYKIIYTEESERDLLKVYSYIAMDLLVPDTAKEQIDRIIKSINDLDELPMRYKLFQNEPWHSKGLRLTILLQILSLSRSSLMRRFFMLLRMYALTLFHIMVLYKNKGDGIKWQLSLTALA